MSSLPAPVPAAPACRRRPSGVGRRQRARRPSLGLRSGSRGCVPWEPASLTQLPGFVRRINDGTQPKDVSVDHDGWLAERFDEHRTRLKAVGYRMLGSLSEADDAVQETWLRLNRTDSGSVQNLGGWLTTVLGRVCLDMLRARKSRREEPLGAHVPEPIVSYANGLDPEHEALLADSVGLALQVILDTLAPAERLAFVLHDMFAVPFDQIALILGRS